MIYAIDFDGTIVEDKYPDIGKPNENVIAFINSIVTAGHKIILNTCRTNERLEEAVRYCNSIGIIFDSINCNLNERIEEYGGDCRKISADYYLDDRNIFIGDIT